MKNFALVFIAIICFNSFGCFAQSNKHVIVNAKIDERNLIAGNDVAVVSYHVEERINMTFGSNITTYDVTSLSQINTNDLGQNNVRIVTPKYAKVKTVAVTLNLEIPKIQITNHNAIVASSSQIKIDVIRPKKRKDYVNIDVVDTYERILDKGYKSKDMIKKVADRHFFDEDMMLAAKWYTELFDIETNLDAVYYFRYAQSLKATGQTKKADEMMKIFESKNL